MKFVRGDYSKEAVLHRANIRMADAAVINKIDSADAADILTVINNIKEVTNIDIARIVLAVTDVHEENRLMRHLMTMGKTVKDFRAIVLKLCDIHANASYSKKTGSSMYKKYVKEYEYRRPIFKTALKWYSKDLNEDVVNELWKNLDEIHEYKKVV